MTMRIIDRITGAVIGALALALIAVLAGVVNAGPLDPPGPPAATDGVLEPGTPISSLPFETTGPGHYYLTRNLVGVADSPGIIITHSDVTLDLNGFHLQGVVGSVDGIVLATVSNITIRNGTISGWGGSGILFENPPFSVGSTFYDLHVSNNAGHGIRAGDRANIHDVTVHNNTLDGIFASRNAVIERCTVTNNGGDGIDAPFQSVVTDCSVTNNTGDGINAGQNSVVRGNAVASNGGDGIQVSSLSLAEQNSSNFNGQQGTDGAGVRGTGVNTRIVDNLLAGNDYGIAASGGLVTGNFASTNTDNYGQVTGSVIGPVLDFFTIDDPDANPHANFQ